MIKYISRFWIESSPAKAPPKNSATKFLCENFYTRTFRPKQPDKTPSRKLPDESHPDESDPDETHPEESHPEVDALKGHQQSLYAISVSGVYRGWIS